MPQLCGSPIFVLNLIQGKVISKRWGTGEREKEGEEQKLKLYYGSSEKLEKTRCYTEGLLDNKYSKLCVL